jgi:hypothetical protein
MIAARSHRRQMPVRSRPAERRNDVVPYDYGATFRISGRPGNVVQSVINTAPDSLFVAVAIGYGFEEDRGRPLIFDPVPNEDTLLLGDITLGDLPASALIEGLRVNPRFVSQVFDFTGSAGNGGPRGFSQDPVPASSVRNGSYFQQVKAPAEITFLFSMLDSGTGRELQDEPVHNLASLGKSNGERPFRLLAQPITFLPRTTMRLQIVERSQDVLGTLFVVLYGYQIVGASSCSELLTRHLTGPPACRIETIGNPSARVIPFDYVTTFELTGSPYNQLESETTVNAEGGFVATSIGYGLLVAETEVPIQWPLAANDLIDLEKLSLDYFPPTALIDGIRIRPDRLRLAFNDDGHLSNALRPEVAAGLFERLDRPEDVSFRYSIFDSGRGRDLQNMPLNNIAGLGSADGDRPFKRLARSIIFQPRSTIRIRIDERFGRGTLFIVLQGYKVLGAGAGR